MRQNRTDQLLQAVKDRILILDGAMGTMIQRYTLTEEDFRTPALKDHHKSLKGNNDLLSLSRPDIIRAIHEEYLKAGSDIIETNTFSGTTIAQEDYGLPHLAYAINFESAKIAREVADAYSAANPDKPRFVAGAMGPTNRTASISPDVNDPGYRAVTFNDLRIAYKQQVEALIDGGVDLLLVETVFDTLNAKAALFAIEQVFEKKGVEIPIMVSGTITDQSGRTLSGQTTEAFLISTEHAPITSIGLNCALGAKELKPYLQVMSKKSPFLVSAHPNAGLPNAMGQYDEAPHQTGHFIEEWAKNKFVNIVGGCCGTTPDHIKQMADNVRNLTPRSLPILDTTI